MVISVPTQPSSGPYLVRGLKNKNLFFAGVDSLNTSSTCMSSRAGYCWEMCMLGIGSSMGANTCFHSGCRAGGLGAGASNSRAPSSVLLAHRLT